MKRKGLGKLIKAAREKKGLTQEELAATLYVTSPAVSNWERDANGIDDALIPKIEEALDVKLSEKPQRGRKIIIIVYVVELMALLLVAPWSMQQLPKAESFLYWHTIFTYSLTALSIPAFIGIQMDFLKEKHMLTF